MSETSNQPLHRVAVITAGTTFVLIFVGGLVTSTGSALAVPDWPLAFGKLIPALQGGVRFEYGHRVAAGIVTMLTLALMTLTLMRERRRWVRVLALAAFGLVVFQAILGGITVLFLLPLPIAVAHAATAQAFFCVTVSLAVFTGPWFAATTRRRETSARIPLAKLGAVTTGVIYVQILVGALMRHLGAGLAIPDFPASFGQLVPPVWDEYIAINFAHRCGAAIVTCMIVWTAARVFAAHRDDPRLRRPAEALIVLLATQLSLGAITVWSARAVIPTTSHVAVGAAVLATSLTLTIRAWRLFGIRRTDAMAVPQAASVQRRDALEERRVTA